MDSQPTRVSSAVFRVKVLGLRLHRRVQDLRSPITRHPTIREPLLPIVVAQSVTPLWTDPRDSEQWYQRGKVQNLRVAVRAVDGCVVPAGEVFSFWKQVGPPRRARGFARGRMLQEGCLLPSTGGGLCQITNALYQLALVAECEIVERHAHSRTVLGSATAAGRDATVAWNYIDLRFRAPCDLQLTAELTSQSLVVALRARHPVALTQQPLPEPAPSHIGADHACDTCDATSCYYKEALPPD